MLPIRPREIKHRKGIRRKLIELLRDYPKISVGEAATYLAIGERFIRTLKNSDAFQHDLHEARRAKYGDTLHQVQQKTLDAELAALERMETNLQDPALNPSEAVATAKTVFEHTENTIGTRKPESDARIAITINTGDLTRARSKALEHAENIELEDQNASGEGAKQVEDARVSYLPPGCEEGEPL